MRHEPRVDSTGRELAQCRAFNRLGPKKGRRRQRGRTPAEPKFEREPIESSPVRIGLSFDQFQPLQQLQPFSERQ
jgi:hypothetical protein